MITIFTIIPYIMMRNIGLVMDRTSTLFFNCRIIKPTQSRDAHKTGLIIVNNDRKLEIRSNFEANDRYKNINISEVAKLKQHTTWDNISSNFEIYRT